MPRPTNALDIRGSRRTAREKAARGLAVKPAAVAGLAVVTAAVFTVVVVDPAVLMGQSPTVTYEAILSCASARSAAGHRSDAAVSTVSRGR